MALSKEEIIKKFVALPLQHKILITLVAVAAIGFGFWTSVYKKQERKISQLREEIREADEGLLKKRTIANNLPKFRREVERLNQELKEALTLLPNTADIPDLLTKVADMAEKSGLALTTFKLYPEAPHQFYADVPVKMVVNGSFQELAVFFDKVAKLPRIINVQNLTMETPTPKNQKMIVKAAFDATTYRFLSVEEAKKSAEHK